MTPGRGTAPGFFVAAAAMHGRARIFRFRKLKERQAMTFQKGQSGNPAGRPRGSRNRAAMLLQNLLERDAERIACKAIDLAKKGDIAAIRMCMDRLVPARKDDAIVFELPPLATAADSVAAAAAIAAAVAAGELTASEAAHLAKVIDVYVQALATAGFEERLARLESNADRRAPAPAAVPGPDDDAIGGSQA
jgi:Family of unknown function (DUF5681)